MNDFLYSKKKKVFIFLVTLTDFKIGDFIKH